MQKMGGTYRYGYQGEFADDETNETGWNSFELRMYDPVIGRWMAVDPARQFASPYLGMGNDPINGVDPDGAFRTRTGAMLYKIFNGGQIHGNKEDGFTVTKVINDGDPTQGILNSVQIVSGWEGQDGLGSLFDTFGKLLQDELGVMIIGSGGGNVSFNNRASGKIITIDLEEFLSIVNPIMQKYPKLVNHNNFYRTVSNPNAYDRAKAIEEMANKINEAVKQHGKVHFGKTDDIFIHPDKGPWRIRYYFSEIESDGWSQWHRRQDTLWLGN